MRDLFKNLMTGSMIAGAALLVSACGGSEEASTNNTAGGNYTEDTGMLGNDTTGADAMNGTMGNLGAEAGMNTTGTTGTTTDTGTNTTTTTTETNTTGTGTGNATGM